MDISRFLEMLYAPIHDVRNSKFLSDLIDYSSSSGSSIDTVVFAINDAVNDSVCCYYNITDNITNDSDGLSVCAELLVPEQISYKEVKIYYPKYSGEKKVWLDLYVNKFPDKLKELTKERLLYYLESYKEQELNKRLNDKVRTVVDGEILSVNKDFIEVQVGFDKAIMEKKDFVPLEKESNLYLRGKILKFYVTRRDNYSQTLFVSRSSKKLPEKLLMQILKEQRMMGKNYPIYKFKCKRRIIGKLSVIKSDAPFKAIREIVKKVRKELNNEEMSIKPFV